MHMRGDIVIVKGGEVSSILTTEPKGSLLPQLRSVSPLAATRGEDCRLSLEVKASGLDGFSDSILCGLAGASAAGYHLHTFMVLRNQHACVLPTIQYPYAAPCLAGHYLPVAGFTALVQGTRSIEVDISGADVSAGALRLVGRRGALTSNTLSVLIMPCAASAAEICQLEGSKGRCLPGLGLLALAASVSA